MLTEQQKVIQTEFRKYLRIEENVKRTMLDNFINVAVNKLPTLIKRYVRNDFNCLFDDVYTIEELLKISSKLKNDEEIQILPYGYVSTRVIDAYIRFFAQKNNINLDELSSVDNEGQVVNQEEEKRQIEGRLTEAKVLRRQRNRRARQQCLEASGYKCYVCGFDFEKTYGEIGKGFLEVHHTKPLATYDEEHEIPQSELCALCSNCHSMVHRSKEVLDVEELKRIHRKYSSI